MTLYPVSMTSGLISHTLQYPESGLVVASPRLNRLILQVFPEVPDPVEKARGLRAGCRAVRFGEFLEDLFLFSREADRRLNHGLDIQIASSRAPQYRHPLSA